MYHEAGQLYLYTNLDNILFSNVMASCRPIKCLWINSHMFNFLGTRPINHLHLTLLVTLSRSLSYRILVLLPSHFISMDQMLLLRSRIIKLLNFIALLLGLYSWICPLAQNNWFKCMIHSMVNKSLKNFIVLAKPTSFTVLLVDMYSPIGYLRTDFSVIGQASLFHLVLISLSFTHFYSCQFYIIWLAYTY